METLLVVSGLLASVIGVWRGHAAARNALGPLIHPGEPTLTAVEATRPPLARARVRRFAHGVVLSVGWLLVALYGLFLVSVGTAAR